MSKLTATVPYLGNPSSSNSLPSLSPAVSQFAAYLKAIYKSSPASSQKWPPEFSKEYIELELVEGDEECRDDYIGHVLQGNIEEIPRRISKEEMIDLYVHESVGGK